MPETKRNFITEDLKTPAGKELAVFKVGNTSLFSIGFASGGQVPENLLGHWTDPVMAQRAIKVYLARLEQEKITEEARLVEQKAKEAANRAANVPKNTPTVSKKKTTEKKATETKEKKV